MWLMKSFSNLGGNTIRKDAYSFPCLVNGEECYNNGPNLFPISLYVGCAMWLTNVEIHFSTHAISLLYSLSSSSSIHYSRVLFWPMQQVQRDADKRPEVLSPQDFCTFCYYELSVIRWVSLGWQKHKRTCGKITCRYLRPRHRNLENWWRECFRGCFYAFSSLFPSVDAPTHKQKYCLAY